MQQEQDKRISVTKLILVILVLILGTCLFYEKFLAKEDKCDEKNDIEEALETEKTPKVAKKYIQDFSNSTLDNNVKIIISKEGEAFITYDYDYYDCISNKKEEESSICDDYKASADRLEKKYKKYEIDGYYEVVTTENGFENDYNRKFYGIKLPLIDVVAVYDGAMGIDVDTAYYLFLKRDGTISSLSYSYLVNQGDIKITNNVCKLNNIVALAKSNGNGQTGGTMLAIDKNGQRHLLAGGNPKIICDESD